MTDVAEGKSLARAGRRTVTKFKAHIDLLKKKDELFGFSTDNMVSKKVLVKDWGC